MRFPNTRWTMVDAAQQGDREALNALLVRYQAPLLAYLRGRGLGSEAEDVLQEVLLTFSGEVLGEVDPAVGRLRDLLRGVARNLANSHLRRGSAQKRGGGRQRVDLDFAQEDAHAGEVYDREWLTQLVQLGLARLKEEHPSYYDALRRFLFEQQSYSDVAVSLERSPQEVKNQIYRGRKKLAAYIEEEVSRYELSTRHHATELAFLNRLLDRRG